MFEKFNRFQIFIVPIFICYPLAVLFSIIQIQHGSHGIHPEAVYMVMLHPHQRAAYQEVFHLVLAIVKNLGAPVRMLAFFRVCIFIQAGSVKLCKAMGIPREMGGYPVQNYADSMLMQVIHQIRKICRRPIPGSGRIVACYLIPPRTVEGIF